MWLPGLRSFSLWKDDRGCLLLLRQDEKILDECQERDGHDEKCPGDENMRHRDWHQGEPMMQSNATLALQMISQLIH